MDDQKKPKSGFARLKIKHEKALAQIEELERKYKNAMGEKAQLLETLTNVINEKDSFADDCKRLYQECAEKEKLIVQQGHEIVKLKHDLNEANGNLVATQTECTRQLEDMHAHMGFFHRWLWDIRHYPANE